MKRKGDASCLTNLHHPCRYKKTLCLTFWRSRSLPAAVLPLVWLLPEQRSRPVASARPHLTLRTSPLRPPLPASTGHGRHSDRPFRKHAWPVSKDLLCKNG